MRDCIEVGSMRVQRIKNFKRSLSIQCHNLAETFDMEVGVRAVGVGGRD